MKYKTILVQINGAITAWELNIIEELELLSTSVSEMSHNQLKALIFNIR